MSRDELKPLRWRDVVAHRGSRELPFLSYFEAPRQNAALPPPEAGYAFEPAGLVPTGAADDRDPAEQ